MSTSIQASWSIFKEENGYNLNSLLKINIPFCLEFKFISGVSIIRVSLLDNIKESIKRRLGKESDSIAILQKILNFQHSDQDDFRFISKNDQKLETLFENKLSIRKVIINLDIDNLKFISEKRMVNGNLITRLLEYFQIFKITGSISLEIIPYSDIRSNNYFYNSKLTLKINYIKNKTKEDSVDFFNSTLKEILNYLKVNKINYFLTDKSKIFSNFKSKFGSKKKNLNAFFSLKKLQENFLFLPLELIPEVENLDLDLIKGYIRFLKAKSTDIQPSKIALGYKIKPGWIPYPIQYIEKKDLATHISCFGLTSQGKSRFMYHLLSQLPKMDINYLIFDLKGEYLQSLQNEENKFLFFKIGSKSNNLFLNFFEIPTGFDKEDHINFLNSLFYQVIGENATPQMIRILNEAISKTVLQKGNFGSLIYYIKNPKILGITGAYLELSVSGLLNRILPLSSGISGKCFNVKNSNINYYSLMNNNVIIDLSLFEETENNVARKILVNTIYYYFINFIRRKRGKVRNPESIENAIIIEEAQKIVPSNFEGKNEIKTPLGMSTWTVRAYGVSMIFIGTDPILESSIISNTGINIVFYGKYDLYQLSKQLGIPLDNLKDILPVLRQRQMFLFSNKSETQLCKSFAYSIPSKELFTFQYYDSFHNKR